MRSEGRPAADGRQTPVRRCTAATALEHGLKLVTRTVAHFIPLGVECVDPWRFAGSG
ncbi:hypothetical protein [Rhizobium aegyptiacum]|uniref:hypothetical protein n=1 Tax=Rhizobium aegyptiacum TaxID=1764550 RepID=UPI000AD6CC0A|nr:hypothetical protein [Rhizobium aegyptiacum]